MTDNADIVVNICDNSGTVLAAVSGGADSVAMLRMLNEAGAAVTAAHYNHMLRRSANEDEAFVRELCGRWNVPFVSERGDVRDEARRSGRGIEETARDMRYSFLERARVQAGCDCIATAHTADDNAETVLLSLTRGSGLPGLTGIPPRRGNILRPLLYVSREEVINYLTQRNIPYREDESNSDVSYRRNFIRSAVIPALKQCNPSLTEAVARMTGLLREDEAYLSSLAQEEYAQYGNIADGRAVFPAKRLAEMAKPVASRVCRILVTAVQPYPPERIHIEHMLDIARGNNGRKTSIPHNLTAEKKQNLLLVYKKQ